MATSGSITTNTLKNSNYYLNWQIASQSIEGNYTDINWQAGINANQNYWYNNAMKINNIVINDTTVFSGGTYSNIEGGSHQLTSGTARIYHNTDGTKSFSASISGWLYSYGNCSGSGSWSLTSIPRYATSNQSLNSKTETTITMNWSSDSTIDYLWYSTNNGSNWTGVDVADGTSGTYTISSLSANSTYNIKTRVRRKDSQLTTDSSSLSITTYNYPHITTVGTTNLTIGKSQTLTLYNPLSRTVTIKMYKDNTSGTQLYSGSTSTTTITFTPTANTLYASIPSAQSGNCVYSAIYGSSTKTTSGAYTFLIVGTETPTFSTFTYKDTNTTVTGVTGNNQVLVKGLSTLQVTIPSANKMVAKNSATAKNYVISIDTLSKTVNYSTSDITSSVGTVTSSGTKRLNVRAYDSRNLSTLAYKDITVYDYAKPVINASITRLNNFEAQTTIKISGTYTRLTIGGADKNAVNSVKYRYRETGGTWSSWVTLTTTVSSGKFTCSDVILSLANTKSFEFEIQAVDKLQTTTATTTLGIGQAIFFISTNKKACYINGQEILMYDVVATW